ncbi:MAG: Asd/ArgC dimerization domain-containing protein [Vicinamibacteria bacterium]
MRGYRVGIVGPRSAFAQRVRALLSEGELPVTEIKLFESELDGEGTTLTQFGDEVVVTQPLDPELFPHLDVLFVSGEGTDTLNRVASEAAGEGVLTLVEGSVGLGAPVVTPQNPEALGSSESRLGILPRVESYLLGTTLAPIAKAHTIVRAVSTVLVPAHSKGDAGAAELHQQVVHILNFKAPPTEVLQEQLAFNVKPLGGSGEGGLSLADAVAWEASRLAGIEGVLTVSLVQVPVFHGYSAALWVETKEPVEPRAVRSLFRSKPFDAPKSTRGTRPPSPVSVAGTESIHIGPIRRGTGAGPPGFWLWAVADTTAYDPGRAGVEIVRSVLS